MDLHSASDNRNFGPKGTTILGVWTKVSWKLLLITDPCDAESAALGRSCVHETKAYNSILTVIKLTEVVSCNAALWKTRQTRLTHIDKAFIHG